MIARLARVGVAWPVQTGCLSAAQKAALGSAAQEWVAAPVHFASFAEFRAGDTQVVSQGGVPGCLMTVALSVVSVDSNASTAMIASIQTLARMSGIASKVDCAEAVGLWAVRMGDADPLAAEKVYVIAVFAKRTVYLHHDRMQVELEATQGTPVAEARHHLNAVQTRAAPVADHAVVWAAATLVGVVALVDAVAQVVAVPCFAVPVDAGQIVAHAAQTGDSGAGLALLVAIGAAEFVAESGLSTAVDVLAAAWIATTNHLAAGAKIANLIA